MAAQELTVTVIVIVIVIVRVREELKKPRLQSGQRNGASNAGKSVGASFARYFMPGMIIIGAGGWKCW